MGSSGEEKNPEDWKMNAMNFPGHVNLVLVIGTHQCLWHFLLNFKGTCYTLKANNKSSSISKILSPKSVDLEA